ncbi:hypothetical protein U472_13975 [Orenia metallireducens]|uniref:Uncharacterized protein n=1 Tax=Orenia metallireducens TaxID=1413210 RepID=A0A1C0A5M8_9FIRM|nr:hypothetical protein [Orenia metallireducens]OCL25452.1 hypothetical protein U472_13975 [Orenia metallireducens]
MSRSSLEEKLRGLNKEELYDLIQGMRLKILESDELILEWLKENEVDCKSSVDDDLLMTYWCKAEEIISEFNEYGGGLRYEEDKAYDYLI